MLNSWTQRLERPFGVEIALLKVKLLDQDLAAVLRLRSHPPSYLVPSFPHATILLRIVFSLYFLRLSSAQYCRMSRSVRARTSLSLATAHSKMSCMSA